MGVGSFRVATIGSVSFLTDRLNAELLVKAGYRSAWSAAQFAGAAYHAASVEEAGWTALWGERRGRAPLPPLRRVRRDGRFRDGSWMAETPLYMRLGAKPESPARRGDARGRP